MMLALFAFLLAAASSTDNFAVGLSTGLAKKRLSARTNCIISICNASGAYFASSVLGTSYATNATGTVSVTSHGWVLSMLASLAFFYLAHKEGQDTNKSTQTDADAARTNVAMSPIMAIPMTLNNLVGGVAGGAVGISPILAATCALFASYVTMALGHWMGMRASSTVTAAARYPPSTLASVIYVILGVASLWDAVTR